MKKIIALILILCFVIIIWYAFPDSPATKSFQSNNSNDYFITVEDCGNYRIKGLTVPLYIVYAKDTHVKYLIGISSKRSMITPRYNADGTLQIYEGE